MRDPLHFEEYMSRRDYLATHHDHPLVLACSTPGCVIQLEYCLRHGEMSWLSEVIGASRWTVELNPDEDGDAIVKCPSCSRGAGPITLDPFARP